MYILLLYPTIYINYIVGCTTFIFAKNKLERGEGHTGLSQYDGTTLPYLPLIYNASTTVAPNPNIILECTNHFTILRYDIC